MKKFLLPVLAVVLAIAGSAFTVNKTVSLKFDTPVWFDFNGTSSIDETNQDKYSLDANNTPDCSGSTTRCEILAYPKAGTNPVRPDLSQGILDQTFKP